jgi:hypothetical protein
MRHKLRLTFIFASLWLAQASLDQASPGPFILPRSGKVYSPDEVWLAVLGAARAEAQTLSGGVKLPLELTNFSASSITDNWEVFGRLSVGAFALEMGVLFPTAPLVVSAHGTWEISETPEGLVVFIGVGGFRIFIGSETFTGFDVKGGVEWGLGDLPLRALVEAGWQSSVEIPLAGAGGFFVNLGVRWDLLSF